MPVLRRALLSTPEVFNPLLLANLLLWFDATRIPVVADGTAISSWTDLSANANHAIQGTGGKQPLYKVAIQNGLPVVRFDNTDDNLLTTNTCTVNVAGVTAFCVGKSGAVAGIFFETGVVFTVNSGFAMERDGSGDRMYIARSGDVGNSIADSTGYSASVMRTWSATWNAAATSGESQVYVEGANRSTMQTNSNNTTNLLTTAAKINIGSRNSGASAPLNGDIGELLIFTRLFPDPERAQVETYLRNKWRTS